mgnify:CR=1 FL=1
MTQSLVTPPAGLPVTLAQVKAHLRIETDDDDDYLGELTALAVSHVEQATGVFLLTQTWRVYLDCLPAGAMVELPVRPISQIDVVTVYDVDGDPSVVAASDYQLDAVSEIPRLRFAAMPSPGIAMNGIEIDCICGFGDTGADVPDQLIRAILVLCAHWYEFRGSGLDAAGAGLEPEGFAKLIAPWKKVLL